MERFLTGLRWRRLVSVAAVSLVAGLLLTGCEVDVELGLDVHGDGSGRLSLLVRADRELLRRAVAAEVDPFAPMRRAARELAGRGWRLQETALPAGGRSVALSTELTRPQELAGITTELAAALDTPEVRPLEPFLLEVTDDTLTVVGEAGLELTEEVAALGFEPEEARALLAESLDYTVAVDLPDEVLDSTADRTVDGQLRWRIEPGERQVIVAEGVRPSWLTAAVVVALVALALALGLVLVAWWAARRRT